MGRKLKSCLLLFAAAVCCYMFISFSSNPPNGRTGAPGETATCASCHTENNPNGFDGNLSITGIPATIQPNTIYSVTVTTSNPNELASQAGFQWVALNSSNQNSGVMSAPSNSSTVTVHNNRIYHEHNPAQAFGTEAEVSWTVNWNSPSAGDEDETITFYGISVIGDGGGNDGDYVVQTQFSATLSNNAPLEASISDVENVSCHGLQDGQATATGLNGMPPYAYNWSTGDISATITNLGPGAYTVTVTDAEDSTATTSITIEEPDSLIVGLDTLTTIDCNNATGMASVSVSGGTPEYTFAWSSGASDSVAMNLQQGPVTVVVTDANLCTDTLEVEITADTLRPMVNAGQADTLDCFALELTLNGTAQNCPDCSILWTTSDGHIVSGADTETPVVDAAGTYTLTATNNATGCLDSSTVTIVEIAAPQLNIAELQNISCNGAADGFISVTTTGGFPPFTYLWSNGESENGQMNLAPGSYTVTVTDANGCIDSLSATIQEPDSLTIMATSTDESAFEANDGTASLEITGGTPPYNIQWNTGATTPELDSLPPGLYPVFIMDDNGCTAFASLQIAPFVCVLQAAVSTEPVSCNGSNDGSATVVLNNVTDPVNISWSSGGNGMTQTELAGGTYEVTVTDSTNCTIIETFEITEPAPIQIELSSFQNVACNGSTTGAVRVEVAGGTPGYAYLWSNGSTQDFITNVPSGNYTVTVTDTNDCTSSYAITLTQPPFLELSIAATNETAVDANDGIATPAIEGGVPPYQFNWSNGTTGEIATNLAPGEYQLTVIDDNGCNITGAVVINDFDCPTIIINSQYTPIICPGSQSGNASVVSVPGANQPVSYTWSNGSTDSTINNLPGGMYLVTITDATNCAVIDVFDINEGDPSGPMAIAQDLTVTLDESGQATITPMDLDDGSFDNCMLASMEISQSLFTCEDVGTQSVTLRVTDGTGNFSIDIVTVRVNDEQIPLIENCPSDISITDCATVVEYDPLEVIDNCQVNIQLVEGLVSGSVFPAGLTPVIYEVEDQAGNQAACTFDVTVASDLSFEANTSPPTCFGAFDGQIDIIPSGGIAPYTITGIPFNIGAGSYEITVRDDVGCTVTQDVTVTQPPALNVAIDDIIPEINNQSNGGVAITAMGGTGELSFVWRDLEGNDVGVEEDISGLAAGTYFVWVSDENGCFIILEVEVNQTTAVDHTKPAGLINVFPNPNSGRFTVTSELSNEAITSLSVFDVNGRLVQHYKMTNHPAPDFLIDLSNAANGVYTLKFVVGEQPIYKRVVVSGH